MESRWGAASHWQVARLLAPLPDPVGRALLRDAA
jgi:hypothetical protein